MKSLLTDDRTWRESPTDENLVEEIRKKLNCSEVFARLVGNRYGDNFLETTAVLERGESPEREIFHSPEDLPDLSRAVSRIVEALEESQDIFIHGDFDVDGLSSSALVYRGLKKIDGMPGPGRLKVEVGDRSFGHGISKKVSSRLIDEEYDLLITTDCGVKGIGEITHLNNFGIDVIVTDHHEPPETLPPAEAVVDPKRDDSTYPNPYLSGAGVAYKLMASLLEEVGGDTDEEDYLIQLAALGTVADLVPLIKKGEDENRRLVKRGLEKMRRSPITGISALLGELGQRSKDIKPETISYRIAPKLNSANRVGDPQVSFLLLSTGSRARADHLAKTLIDYDRDRSSLQNRLTRKAINRITEGEFDPEEEGLVFVVGDGWNPGILGLISSRLVNRFNIPAVTVSRERTKCRGSVRGVRGLSIHEGLERCSGYLTKFGGHKMAGGFTAVSSELEGLKTCLKDWARKERKSVEGGEEIYVEGRLEPFEANLDLYREIEKLAPFGKGNPRPTYWMEGLRIVSARRVGDSKNHLKVKLADGDDVLDCIGFGMGEDLPLLKSQDRLNPVFTLELNDWGGRENVQLKLEDFVSQD